MSKDNVLTLCVPGHKLVFTRYLYIKDEVEIALLLSILNKSDDAIFWAYELLHSGFINALFELIWKIYYDFFATLNPSFILYLIKKRTEYFASKEDRIISAIIQDFLIRPFNTDIFFQRQICDLFEFETVSVVTLDELYIRIEDWFKTQDYKSLAYFILNNKKDLIADIDVEIFKYTLNRFNLTNSAKRIKDYLKIRSASSSSSLINTNIILLASIITIISQANEIKKGRNFYVVVEPEEVVQYETIEMSSQQKSYKILRMGCVCNIDNQFLHLFKFVRHNITDIQNKYNTEGLYHAAFSPTWFERIRLNKGYIDYENNQVKFITEDWEEAFYSRYGYEPDEQPQQVKDRCLNHVKRDDNWTHFYEKYRKYGVISVDDDELEALNDELLKY